MWDFFDLGWPFIGSSKDKKSVLDLFTPMLKTLPALPLKRNFMFLIQTYFYHFLNAKGYYPYEGKSSR